MALQILALFSAHYIADFLVQSALPGNVAIHKSHSWRALLLHTSTYALLFAIGWGWQFGLITFVLHTLTDAITSRLTAHYWYLPMREIAPAHIAASWWPEMQAEQWTHFTQLDLAKRSVFWNIIGFDQFLHAAQLILTLSLLS